MKKNIFADQSGGVLVLVALMLVALLGISALAVDIGHLMVVQNQLQNAADAGALAGARILYVSTEGGVITVNPAANDAALTATTRHQSDGSAVEALSGAVERGHWCFTCNGNKGVFTPNDSLTPVELTDFSPAALDANTDYINAVRVVASRGPERPAASFFAGIFGFDDFSMDSDAVAWLGFAGSNVSVTQPIAICQESIQDDDGNFTCTRGRMINSGAGYDSEAGAWTNLEQGEGACSGASPASEIKPLVNEGCSGTISGISLQADQPITTVGGQMQAAYNALYNCWKSKTDTDSDGSPDQPWILMLPRITCGDTNPGPCNVYVGPLRVQVLWVTNQNDPHFDKIPVKYDDPEQQGLEFTCPATCIPTPEQPVCASRETEEGRKLCWVNFLNTFGIVDENGNMLSSAYATDSYLQKNIFFKPSCDLSTAGSSGGSTSNVFAEYPKLVE